MVQAFTDSLIGRKKECTDLGWGEIVKTDCGKTPQVRPPSVIEPSQGVPPITDVGLTLFSSNYSSKAIGEQAKPTVTAELQQRLYLLTGRVTQGVLAMVQML